MADGEMPEELVAVLEEKGINRENLEAAVELGRLVAEETGLCCEELGQFIFETYQRLEGGEGA